MKDNRRYLLVGLFVVIAATISVSVWLWFSASTRQAYNVYLAIFTEPVDGVTTNSVVKYNGVEVGKVKKLELDPKNPRNILVYLNILQHVPINVQTYATMKAQGITGLSFINLSLPKTAKDGQNIKPHNVEPYPIIQTKPSFFYSLTEQAQSVAGNINGISTQVKTMLNDQNIEHISRIVSNLDKISTALASRSEVMSKSIDTMSQILSNVKENTENLNATFKDIKELTKTLSQTTENANGLISSVQNNTLQNINTILLPNLNGAISHLNQSSYQLEQLLTLLNQNPSALVRGKLPAKPGPGE